MRIETVETIGLRRELDEPFAIAQKWIDSREYCLVRVQTTGGIDGWGECWGPIAGNRETIERIVEPWLVGRDPRDVEAIHDDLIITLRNKFHSYVPMSVVGGIDIALWDLLGRVREEPISRLLGGRHRETVRAYATGGGWPRVESFDALRERVVSEMEGHVAAGFDALKTKIGLGEQFPWGPDEDVTLVRAVREAVGENVRVMADANHAYDGATARRVGAALADLDVYYFEEPIPPTRVNQYARLNAALAVPLAGGECWAGVEEFDRVLDAGAVGYVQPDVTSVGGITTTRRVVNAAMVANVQAIPHVFGSAVGLAASLQVLGTIRGEPMLEFDRTPNPIRDELALDPIENDGPTVAIPDGPGLGIEVDERILDEFRVE